MTWVQAHPPGTTSVASTKNQFQQNNLYIENTLQEDHYFDDATASNDGHHKFVQMPVQGADPGVSIAGGGCVYLKNTAAAANPAPWYQMASGVFSIPVGKICGDYALVAGTNNTFSFAGLPAIKGWIYAYNTGSARKAIGSNFIWNGVSLFINQRNSGLGQFVSDDGNHLRQFTSDGSPWVKIITDRVMTVNLSWMGLLD